MGLTKVAICCGVPTTFPTSTALPEGDVAIGEEIAR